MITHIILQQVVLPSIVDVLLIVYKCAPQTAHATTFFFQMQHQ